MALFTDGLISEVQDLIAYEANLLEVADAEGIDLGSKLQLAKSEVGAELGAVALSELDNVVVTSPLKLWHTFQTLAIVYRDAYNRKLNDKYLPKWTEYKELARWASNLLFRIGVGLVAEPVPKAAQPALDWVSGTLPAMTVYVRASWVNGTAEGEASDEVATEIPANQALRVTPPPPPPSPVVVTGWNVYVGTASAGETRQNPSPLAAGEPWVMPAGGLMAGAAPGSGQDPDVYRTVPRVLQRG